MTLDPRTFPDFENFKTQYESDKPQIVYRTIVSDLETPVSTYLKLAGGAPGSFLLESVEGGEVLGRHSIIGMKPDVIWRTTGNRAEINRNALTDTDSFTLDDRPILESFQALLDESAFDLPTDLAPMSAGVFGYFGYDLVRQVEHLPNRPDGGIDIPDGIFIRPTIVIVFDNIRQEMTLATPVRRSETSPQQAYADAQQRLVEVIDKMTSTLPANLEISHIPSVDTQAQAIQSSNTPQSAYQGMVERAKDYIRAGDIFQVVLSQRFKMPFSAPPFELYRALRRENPSPFLFFFNFDSHALVGSSPEILVRVRNGEITIRPIAGTRPRGKTTEEDKAHEISLLADPKERAEHLMLLDLGRNDVGRAAAIGSVRVTDSFIIERYSHVMHIVSNVVGQLRDDATPIDALLAGFPAGTVSGAPKIRAMEIIDELEHEARNAYAGTIGYFSASGDVDTAITLRTAVVKDGNMYVQAGAGIVADSNPQTEHEECINKARALFSAARQVPKSNFPPDSYC